MWAGKHLSHTSKQQHTQLWQLTKSSPQRILPNEPSRILQEDQEHSLQCSLHPTLASKHGEQREQEWNRNQVKNLAQDEDFTVVEGKIPKKTISKQFPCDCPTWEGKIKLCARWCIRGDCYDNCQRVASHITKDKIPADKKAHMLTFMKKCREAAKKSIWLIRSESSGIWPPKKPPDKCLPLPLEFEFQPSSGSTSHQLSTPHLLLWSEETSLPHWQQPPALAPDTMPPLEETSLPPRQQPPASEPDTPNPWLVPTTLTSKAARTAATQAKAREANSLATTND